MTTIAWDGDNLAADSQATRPIVGTAHCQRCDAKLDHAVNHRRKIHVPLKREEVLFNGQRIIAVAGAGEARLIDTYRVGLLNNVPVKTIRLMSPSAKTIVLLVVTEDTVWQIENTEATVTVNEVTQVPYAIGSGAPAALLAMKRLGLTAMAAVACAIDVDKYSGGAVNYLSCRGDADAKIEAYTYTPEDIAELFQ